MTAQQLQQHRNQVLAYFEKHKTWLSETDAREIMGISNLQSVIDSLF